jgi:hypothetical protein
MSSPPVSTCIKLTPADMGWGPYYEQEAVASCPTAQDPEKEAQALEYGLMPIGPAGPNGGINFCTTAPTRNKTATVAFGGCNQAYDENDNPIQGQGTVFLLCERVVVGNNYQVGDDVTMAISVNPSECVDQSTSDPTYVALERGFGPFLSPSLVESTAERIGDTCDPAGAPVSIIGARCEYTNGVADYSCSRIDYADAGFGPVNASITPVDKNECSPNVTYTRSQRQLLASYSLISPGQDVLARCSGAAGDGALFAANRTCKTEVIYPPGWPNSGETEIISGLREKCFAIFNATDPDLVTVQSVDIELCQNQNLTDEERDVLRTLAPDYYPYDELPQQLPEDCEGIFAGMNVNFQRDNTPQDIQVERVADTSTGGRYPNINFSGTFFMATICTDAPAGEYFLRNGQFANPFEYNSFPMSKGLCQPQAALELSGMNNVEQFGQQRQDYDFFWSYNGLNNSRMFDDVGGRQMVDDVLVDFMFQNLGTLTLPGYTRCDDAHTVVSVSPASKSMNIAGSNVIIPGYTVGFEASCYPIPE